MNNLEEESINELKEIEKLMDEELEVWEKPHVEKVNVPNQELQFL